MNSGLFVLGGLIAAAVFVLTGCGGGGGSSSSAPPPTPVGIRTDKVEFGYYGIVEDSEIGETVDHVSYIWPEDWGDWGMIGYQVFQQQRTILQLQEAKARGIKKAIVGIGFLTWDGKFQPQGTQYLQVFRTQLEALGLLDMVYAFYPIDEPDIKIKHKQLTEANLELGLQAIRAVFPEHKLMVIYGDGGGYPAQHMYDYVGQDMYGKGLITMQLMEGQRLVIVRGGSDPWKEDATTAVDYALSHPEVAVIVGFLYGDSGGGKGIRNNGMIGNYREQGLRIKNGG